MNLAKFPRRKYTTYNTPIEKLAHLSNLLEGPTIYIKRDDLLGLAAGGNKTRKLEFLIADAIEQGADILITAGGLQSNHCRLTLAAAVKENLKCILVLEEGAVKSETPIFNGNYFLYHLLGAEKVIVVPNGSDLSAELQKVAKDVAKQGAKPYVIPVGGSNVIGVKGYAACAQEILAQTFDEGLDIQSVVCVSGSGGMHAGLVTGFAGSQSNMDVVGINISRGKKEQEEKVFKLVTETATHIGIPATISRETIKCFDEYVGPGYALPTDEMIEAVKFLARIEGILLDPVYTGKAFAGLIDLIQKGVWNKEDNILFVHSGGTPALFANTNLFC